MKVYVVTAGEYSSYHIEAVFSTPEKADEYLAALRKSPRHSDESPTVEVFELDTRTPPQVRTHWQSVIDLATGIILEREEVQERADDEYPTEEGDGPYDVLLRFVERATKWYATSFKSQDHADKLAVEARQKWLREKAGVV